MLSALSSLALPLLLGAPLPGNAEVDALIVCPGSASRFELMEPGRRYDVAPTNTSVWIYEYVNLGELGPLRLISSGAEQAVEVERELTPMRNSNLLRLKPTQELRPNSTYEVFEGEFKLGGFRTGSEPDNTRPDAPELIEVSETTGSCTGRSLSVQLSNLTDNVFYQVETDRETLGAQAFNRVSFFIGEAEAPAAMRAVAIDLAGNRSVPSLPFEGPVGCVCACAPPAPSFALLLLVGLGLFSAGASREAARASSS